MNELLSKALASMAQTRALLVGDLVLDSYLYGETGRVSREAPVVVVEKRSMEYRLGGGANTAANLSALGVQTTVLSALGNDTGADAIQSRLTGCGVDLAIRRHGALTTPVKNRILAGAYGTAKQQVLRIDETPSLPLPRTVQLGIADMLEELAPRADVVVVADYGLGIVDEAVIAKLSSLAAEGVLVCVDSRHQVRSYRGVTAVTPNVPEVEAALGVSLHGDASVARAGRQLQEELDCRAVLMTLGRSGMSLFKADGTHSRVPIVGEDEVTDVTGAGDTVCATFAAAIAARVGMVNAMRLANLAASIVVNKQGTATASTDEMLVAGTRFSVELEPWGG
ncbi:MAG: bifunctional ADP-heptose synthase [Myxococcota bacterium]